MGNKKKHLKDRTVQRAKVKQLGKVVDASLAAAAKEGEKPVPAGAIPTGNTKPEYDASGDLVKMPDWEFDCIGNNAVLRRHLDKLLRCGEIFHEIEKIPFKDTYISEPRFFGPKVYEDYGAEKRVLVPFIMVFAIYYTIRRSQNCELENAFRLALETVKSQKKKELIVRMTVVWKDSLMSFQDELDSIFSSLNQHTRFVVASNTALKNYTTLKGKDAEGADFEMSQVCQLIYAHFAKRWLNTYELQRCKAAMLFNMIATVVTMERDPNSMDYLRYVNRVGINEQVGSDIYYRFENTVEHPFTDMVFITRDVNLVQRGIRSIYKEFEAARVFVTQREHTQLDPIGHVECELARYDDQGRQITIRDFQHLHQSDPDSQEGDAQEPPQETPTSLSEEEPPAQEALLSQENPQTVLPSPEPSSSSSVEAPLPPLPHPGDEPSSFSSLDPGNPQESSSSS